MTMPPTAKFFVAGHRGLVGSAIVRALERHGYPQVLTRTRQELDFTDAAAVERFFSEQQPDYVVLAAAKVGGIVANSSRPAEFIRDNLCIQTNVIHQAHQAGAKRLLFLGSSCIYPKLAPQPLREDMLLSGPLEPTNRAYAVAKIAGVEMCASYNRQYGTNFLAVMPTNLYGPNDNYDPESSHVIPGMLQRFHHAKSMSAAEVVLWGSGTPLREFLYSDDLAEACVLLLCLGDPDFQTALGVGDAQPLINVGSGVELTIRELAQEIAAVVGYEGRVTFDTSRPDGTPRKLLDSSRILALGWRPRMPLREGLQRAYAEVLQLEGHARSLARSTTS